MISKNSSIKPLSITLDVTGDYTLYPGDKVTIKHYNGHTIKFDSPGFCRFIYHGGFGFDIQPIDSPSRFIEITLVKPPYHPFE